MFRRLVFQHHRLFLFGEQFSDHVEFFDTMRKGADKVLAEALQAIVDRNLRLVVGLETRETQRNNFRSTFLEMLDHSTAEEIGDKAMFQDHLRLQEVTTILIVWASSPSCYELTRQLKGGQILKYMKHRDADIDELISCSIPNFDGCTDRHLRLLGMFVAELARVGCFDLAKYCRRMIVNGSLNGLNFQSLVSSPLSAFH